ncbi:hypothetical protein [Paraburkholderia sp. BCC1886]|nr:hypothetical protein [Paraburkholderia sp. BCC1886]
MKLRSFLLTGALAGTTLFNAASAVAQSHDPILVGFIIAESGCRLP